MTGVADPQDVKSEEALLGAVLLSPGTVKKARLDQELSADDFYRESHGQIWDAAIRCMGNGGCDTVSVAAELKRRGQEIRGHNLDGLDYLQSLAQTVPAPGNAKAYAERVKETAEFRKLRRFALSVVDGVEHEDKNAIARALDALGQRVLFVDVESGEAVETCPTCIANEKIIEKKEHRERSLLSQISKLEGKAEKKAKEHKLWEEIAACFDIYKVATGHFDVSFTAEEFNQALPRFKQYGKGSSPATATTAARGPNPCKPALKAICGIAYDPQPTRGRNKKERFYDKWELLHRNQFSWPDFHARVPSVPAHPNPCECEECDVLWWRCLMDLIEGNLKK